MIGYTPSDAITLMLSTGDESDARVFFDRYLSPLTPVFAFMATATFNALVLSILPEKHDRLACFDCRVWTVPTEQEAVNCLIWRERDATQNCIQRAAQALSSQTPPQQKPTSELQERLGQQGITWQDDPARCMGGWSFQRRVIARPCTVEEGGPWPP